MEKCITTISVKVCDVNCTLIKTNNAKYRSTAIVTPSHLPTLHQHHDMMVIDNLSQLQQLGSAGGLNTDAAPRQDILFKFCPVDLAAFKNCMGANGNDENKCMEPKTLLDKCAGGAFRTVNMAGAGNWLY